MSIFRVLDRSIGGELGSSKNYDLQRHMTRHILLNHKVILIISFFNDNNKNDQIAIILILLTHVKSLKGIVVNLTEIPFYILLTYVSFYYYSCVPAEYPEVLIALQ